MSATMRAPSMGGVLRGGTRAPLDCGEDVSLDVLDGLVIEAARELYGEDPADSARVACELARSHVLAGDIPAALEVARRETPGVLDDKRLLFKLYLVNFEQLARVDYNRALVWCREHLAPLAMEAYPEVK